VSSVSCGLGVNSVVNLWDPNVAAWVLVRRLTGELALAPVNPKYIELNCQGDAFAPARYAGEVVMSGDAIEGMLYWTGRQEESFLIDRLSTKPTPAAGKARRGRSNGRMWTGTRRVS